MHWGQCLGILKEDAESVADGVVAAWHKQPGEAVARDELLVEIETDKVVMEVVAPESGVLSAILIEAGETIVSEALLATLTPGEGAAAASGTVSAVSSETDQSSEGASGDAIPMGPAVRALLDEHGRRMSARQKGWPLVGRRAELSESHEAARKRIPRSPLPGVSSQ